MMNLPVDFVREIHALLPAATEADALLDALGGDPATSIRINCRKGGDAPSAGTAVPWCPAGRYLDRRPTFTLDPLLHAGGYYVQEASSMFLWHVLRHCAGTAPVRMLDLCAAPGGKSTLACDALPTGSVLVANEVVRSRAQVLAENLCKWGHPDVVVTQNDPADFAGLGPLFDVVLVDAPCSGEGMFRKDPASVGEWSREGVTRCARRQRRILSDILPCLRPGGLLIYSTCTYNVEEDEENVRWLRDEQGLEVLAVPEVPMGEWGITGCLLPGEDLPAYRFMPHRARGEGFFLAALRKPGEADDDPLSAGTKARRRERGKSDVCPKEWAAQARSWLADDRDWVWTMHGACLAALPGGLAPLVGRLRPALRILQAGVAVGEAKGRDLLPRHALAMSTALRPGAFPRVEVGREQALGYLRREPLVLPGDTPRGFVLLTWGGLPLGFAKHIGSRANNLYPQEWRIRLQA